MVAGQESLVTPNIQQFQIPSHWLTQADFRLDATYYTSHAIWASMLVRESDFLVKPLSDKEVLAGPPFWPPRFKRIYTPDRQMGKPFISANETFMLRPEKRRWVAVKQVQDLDNYLLRPGWILMSRSGTIGRCRLVTPYLETYLVTDDLMRILPALPSGYIYAFLSSWIGQALIKKQQYGATVTHIEPHHLKDIPIPILPKNEREAIHKQVEHAYRLRDEANLLLDQAEALLYQELELPQFDDSKVPYLFSYTKPQAFTVEASHLQNRFDASYHIPRARAALSILGEGRYNLVPLKDLADPFIPPRFKRIYVESEYGVPFLQGSHVPMIKPFDIKYLSRAAHKNLEPWIIKAGWVMITCSGTIGRIALVPKQWEGWAASQHIERIVPKDKNQAGYIAAFLMTPYGQIQLASKVYGGVVDELTAEDTGAIMIPDAPADDVQRKIGDLVLAAYENNAKAIKEEDEAIANFERTLEERFVQKGLTPFRPREKTLEDAMRATWSANWEISSAQVEADVQEAISSAIENSEQP